MSEQVPAIVVMGVSGSGKTTIGQMLADELNRQFIDGDSLHPVANKNKMAAGEALNDQDREPWLRVIGEKLSDGTKQSAPLVIACSALKRSYRDLIRSLEPSTIFVHLTGGSTVIRDRMNARSHEYMPSSLLDSQLATLELPTVDEAVLTADISNSPEDIVRQLAADLNVAHLS
ncbi:gluconokinase [Arthrobacter sp. NIO-1057]|uniref:gluconokinase n=1 Tax=Arthrobacter sp. NIO-1057 TaxID=993071 RepID=UPI00071D33BD|nr:gluconokinase [Arthrobacter sp. NIO-1057]KSU67809.1 transferase [Arthrobacter sp. NIO-1057]SCB79734.1 gluconokinase [Arthrobacter sp. NIO-1057]